MPRLIGVGADDNQGGIATTGQGGLMTDEIAERDESPGHVSTGQLPTPDDGTSA